MNKLLYLLKMKLEEIVFPIRNEELGLELTTLHRLRNLETVDNVHLTNTEVLYFALLNMYDVVSYSTIRKEIYDEKRKGHDEATDELIRVNFSNLREKLRKIGYPGLHSQRGFESKDALYWLERDETLLITDYTNEKLGLRCYLENNEYFLQNTETSNKILINERDYFYCLIMLKEGELPIDSAISRVHKGQANREAVYANKKNLTQKMEEVSDYTIKSSRNGIFKIKRKPILYF